jgi:hypothetical protein
MAGPRRRRESRPSTIHLEETRGSFYIAGSLNHARAVDFDLVQSRTAKELNQRNLRLYSRLRRRATIFATLRGTEFVFHGTLSRREVAEQSDNSEWCNRATVKDRGDCQSRRMM